MGKFKQERHATLPFAVPLEVIFRENGPIFHKEYLLLHSLEGNGIIYRIILYFPIIEENVKIYFNYYSTILVAIVTYYFSNLRSALEKNPENSKECFVIFIYSNCKKRTLFN